MLKYSGGKVFASVLVFVCMCECLNVDVECACYVMVDLFAMLKYECDEMRREKRMAFLICYLKFNIEQVKNKNCANVKTNI